MSKYICLLRGINVGGHKLIKMADLRALYESLGFANVVTYIQSGNVIFETEKKSKAALKSRVEAIIEEHYQFQVPVVIRTPKELATIISNCPFGKIDLASEGTKVSAAFLSKEPSKSSVDRIQEFVHQPEKLVVLGSEAYLYCPNGCARSKLTTKLIESKLGVSATVRNWKTVHKLLELAND